MATSNSLSVMLKKLSYERRAGNAIADLREIATASQVIDPSPRVKPPVAVSSSSSHGELGESRPLPSPSKGVKQLVLVAVQRRRWSSLHGGHSDRSLALASYPLCQFLVVRTQRVLGKFTEVNVLVSFAPALPVGEQGAP